ncbi:hypothetical protein PG984_004727 [Apiospora sp. TS-2023a]
MRVVIDRKSCAPEPIYNAVKSAFVTARGMAKGAASVWDKWTPDNGQWPQPQDAYRELMSLLAGSDSETKQWNLITAFITAGDLQLVDQDIWSSEWRGTVDMRDVIIVCDANHVVPLENHDEPNINNFDTIQMRPVEDGRSILALRDGTSPASFMAVTSSRKKNTPGQAKWNPKSPEVITLSSGYLKGLQDKGFPRYSKELINNARLDTVNKAAARAAGRPIKNSVDLLNTLEMTLLHEVDDMLPIFCPGVSQWLTVKPRSAICS